MAPALFSVWTEIVNTEPDLETAEKGNVRTIVLNPDSNHCTIDGFVEIELPPGETCEILTQYGIEGYIECSRQEISKK